MAVVEENAKAKGNFDVAVAYLQQLYETDAQELAAKHFYRPRAASVLFTLLFSP